MEQEDWERQFDESWLNGLPFSIEQCNKLGIKNWHSTGIGIKEFIRARIKFTRYQERQEYEKELIAVMKKEMFSAEKEERKEWYWGNTAGMSKEQYEADRAEAIFGDFAYQNFP